MSDQGPLKDLINIDESRYDQSTYWGRAKHFFTVTDSRNLFKSTAELDEAKDIITKYKNGEDIPGLTEDKLWDAKYLYDSAHHPETGERQIWFGRMSAQAPMNMLITGCMLTFYKTNKEVIFWQWFNQSFNAVVKTRTEVGTHRYLRRSQLAKSYCMATGGALMTALTLNGIAKKAPPIFGRFVPFCAVAAANCVNIPMMRQKELQDGLLIVDENGNKLGHSQIAAKKAITQVVMSRIGMCVPGMILPPFLMDALEKRGVLRKMPWISAPLQIALCRLFVVLTTPMCCALLTQKSSIAISSLEPAIQEAAAKRADGLSVAYYNKGL